MKLYKQVTKVGSVTIPRIVRDELNIPKGCAVELETTGDGLLIRKHVPTCMICGTADHVHKLGDVELCADHLQEMLEKEEEEHDHRDPEEG